MSSQTTITRDEPAGVAGHWDAYWQHRQPAGISGLHEMALGQFWSRIFDRAHANATGTLHVLDIGCGDGVVARLASAFGGARKPDVDLRVWGMDYSHAALADVRRRAPQISCIAGDAAHLPFRDGTFDLVTSQFGIEYAEPGALCEAARLLRPRGVLATAMHVRGGGIYRECRINRQAVEEVRECNLLGLFQQLVEAFHRARQGVTGKAAFDAAYGKFVEAVTRTEHLLQRWGRAVASGMVFRLYSDVVRMVQRLQAFEARELIAWAELMARELGNYSRRMTTMLDAALSREMIESVTARLRGNGLNIQLRNLLRIGDRSVPVAWMVAATKDA